MPILRKVQKNLTNREWYHQRFDGAPMFIYFIAGAELRREKRKPQGTEADIRVCFFSKGKADWYLDVSDIKRGAEVILKKAKNDSRVSEKLLSLWKKDERVFEDFYEKEFFNINLALLDDKKLLNLWDKFCRLTLNRVSSSSIIDHFALGTDELIHSLLRKEVGKLDTESDFTHIFSIATAPAHISFINTAEIELLKIIIGASSETIREYQARYYWTRNNYYMAHVISVKEFQKEVMAWKRSGKNLSVELNRILAMPKDNKRKKSHIIKKYNFSKYLRNLLKISEDFTWWQDERKKSTYWYIDMGSRILSEVASRTRYNLDELKYALPHEISDIIENKIPARSQLAQRCDKSVFVATRNGTWFETKGKADDIHNLMFTKKSLDEIQDIRGLSASTGRAIGIARIIKSATEVSRVNKGDIIVAVMTRPDYVPAMKKASAIVTDEGGITSHAAIVSRELGIPCIIGTKIATQVFKDGDKIEVNANHGWVRKIS